MMKKILKIGLGIVISIFAVIVIAYLLFFSNQRFIFPVEIGKIELNYEVRPNGYINHSPADALESLDYIEQEQGYVDIEELEQLRKKSKVSMMGISFIPIDVPCCISGIMMGVSPF